MADTVLSHPFGGSRITPQLDELLDTDLGDRLLDLHRALREAFVLGSDERARRDAVHLYVGLKSEVARRTGHFGIVNNRVYGAGRDLVVPYLVGDTLVVLREGDDGTRPLGVSYPPRGTIFTDSLLEREAGFRGEVIDLEPRIFVFDAEQAQDVSITRIRDLAGLLQRVNETTNRNEAVYFLRFMVARLCNPAFEALVGAKNLKPEVRHLTMELVRFLDNPLARRIPLLVRLLVRNISGLVMRPNHIDRLWNDTIDLAEIHVPGSGIVNELRRSTHHALGKRSLMLARAYLDFLENGNLRELQDLGYDAPPSQADLKARSSEEAVAILSRVVGDLESLLGTTEVLSRIREWQAEYEDALLRCEFGRSLYEEMAEVLTGLRRVNRWACLHHLRILRRKGESVSWPTQLRESFLEGVASLMEASADQPSTDVEGLAGALERVVRDFAEGLREAYTAELFPRLEAALSSYEEGRHFDAFSQLRGLRKSLWHLIGRGGFTEQRYFLYQLDCLLEEMGYLALTHVSTEFEESGMDLPRCLEIIGMSVRNLAFDGKYSRELLDLAGMLTRPSRSYAEATDLLEYIQKNYHKIVQRVTSPYEKMRDRLGLDEEELLVILGNMKRYMHDLNSMVHFSDMARAFILEEAPESFRPVTPGAARIDAEDFPIVHLSHPEGIGSLVESSGEDGWSLREAYGGKGTGLVYISHLHIPTRDGFVLPTCIARSGRHRSDPQWLRERVLEHLFLLQEDIAGRSGRPKRCGDVEDPLLLAVRGGSVFSMPGIIPTAIFVGMNDDIAESLARDDPWHAYDSYRRFLASLAKTLWGIDFEEFDLVEAAKRKYGVAYKTELPWEGMREVARSSRYILGDMGHGDELEALLADPVEQVVAAVTAVYESWDREMPRRYRAIKSVCDTWNTAVIVQEMASGNRQTEEVRDGMDETRASLTGVIPHTRLTDRGIRLFAGEIKFSASGDDLVGGMTRPTSFRTMRELNTLMPMLNRRLRHTVAKLRRFQGTDQEIEFTVERGVLSVLQSRSAEMASDKNLASFADPGPEATKGIGIRGGAFRGLAAFDDEDLLELSGSVLADRDDVDGVLMVVENPSPDDIPMILQAGGLLTVRGGSSSHAAVAINGIDKSYSAVLSAIGLRVDAECHRAVILGEDGSTRHRIEKGDLVSIQGTSGEVYIGTRPLRS
ncbi:hypothetical protein JW921_07510 [Candidatus Fermentibacterales bacterium]|nr:hypothetical protein [Candidatus Fermentibacterales bacterium]